MTDKHCNHDTAAVWDDVCECGALMWVRAGIRDRVLDVLYRNNVAAEPALVDALVEAGDEVWTTARVAEYTRQTPASVGKWASRHGVHLVPRGSIYSRTDVERIKATMRGQGWRRGLRGYGKAAS